MLPDLAEIRAESTEMCSLSLSRDKSECVEMNASFLSLQEVDVFGCMVNIS